MELTQALHKGARERPEEIVAICKDECITHAQLVERVARLAGALHALGLKPGDRVGMMALNSIRFLEYFYGTWWAGGVVNPVNIRWHPREVAYSLDDCDTRILLVDEVFSTAGAAAHALSASLKTLIYCGAGEVPEGMLSLESLIAQAQPVPDARRGGADLAAVMYTGGTTGVPKGVMLSHGNYYVSALSTIAAVPLARDVTGMIAVPMFHVAGCGMMLINMHRLAQIVIVPMFDPQAVLAAIEEHRVNELLLVPAMISRVMAYPRRQAFDLSSLRQMIYGASPIDATLLEQAMAALPDVQFAQAYGMTELAPTVAVLGPQAHRPGPNQATLLRAAGRPVPIADIRIVDAEGRDCPVSTVGEIVVGGPMVMQGYWNKPDATAAALQDGWMHTGDAGRMDEHGYLFVVDRVKDMIVSGGENVYSAEVENALAQLPQVLMSAVIGVPDDRWGERVHAVIVLHEGETLDEAAVIAHCKTQIAGYKCPGSVEFRKELPLSAAGKMLKFQLREPYWAGRQRRVN